MRTRRLLTAVAVVAALLVADAALAFRPTVRWIVDQVSAARLVRNVKALKVEQEITIYGRDDAPRGLVAPQRTWLMSPSSLRSERELPEGVEVRVWTKSKQLHRKPGQEDRVRKSPPDLVAAFLASGPPMERAGLTDSLVKQIQRLKVDTDVVSYARFDGRICYLIGSKPWETDKPQVWIDKDSLQLVRVVTIQKVEGKQTRSEVRLLGWGSPEGGSWFPKRIEYKEGDELRWSAMTRGLEKNKPMDKALFQTR
jgi:hypothetical protein